MKLNILLDQNVPVAVRSWLSSIHPEWSVSHVKDLGMAGAKDHAIYKFAQNNNAIIITFDEDFADSRFYTLGSHHGIIRLKVWPTTTELTQSALMRLFSSFSEEQIPNSLIIIDNEKIRIRHL